MSICPNIFYFKKIKNWIVFCKIYKNLYKNKKNGKYRAFNKRNF